MPDDDAASSSGSTSGISEGTAAYTIQSSNDPEQGLMNDDSVVIDIPFEKQIKPNGVVRRSTSESKPVFSSIEQFNPSEASSWVKQQIIDRVQEHPKFRSAINYTRIDFFRPYFDVEPVQLQKRLKDAYKPSLPLMQQELTLLIHGTTNGAMCPPQKISPELYGPLMIVLTLAAIIPVYMHDIIDNTMGGSIRDTTLISGILATCLTYWWFGTLIVFYVSQLTKTFVTIVQTASVFGYSMSSMCIVLGVGGITERSNIDTCSHVLFFILWLLVGGVANLRLALVLMGRTPMDYQYRFKRLVVGIVPFLLNMFFMLYLHFFYHNLIETVIDALPEK